MRIAAGTSLRRGSDSTSALLSAAAGEELVLELAHTRQSLVNEEASCRALREEGPEAGKRLQEESVLLKDRNAQLAQALLDLSAKLEACEAAACASAAAQTTKASLQQAIDGADVAWHLTPWPGLSPRGAAAAAGPDVCTVVTASTEAAHEQRALLEQQAEESAQETFASLRAQMPGVALDQLRSKASTSCSVAVSTDERHIFQPTDSERTLLRTPITTESTLWPNGSPMRIHRIMTCRTTSEATISAGGNSVSTSAFEGCATPATRGLPFEDHDAPAAQQLPWSLKKDTPNPLVAPPASGIIPTEPKALWQQRFSCADQLQQQQQPQQRLAGGAQGASPMLMHRQSAGHAGSVENIRSGGAVPAGSGPKKVSPTSASGSGPIRASPASATTAGSSLLVCSPRAASARHSGGGSSATTTSLSLEVPAAVLGPGNAKWQCHVGGGGQSSLAPVRELSPARCPAVIGGSPTGQLLSPRGAASAAAPPAAGGRSARCSSPAAMSSRLLQQSRPPVPGPPLSNAPLSPCPSPATRRFSPSPRGRCMVPMGILWGGGNRSREASPVGPSQNLTGARTLSPQPAAACR